MDKILKKKQRIVPEQISYTCTNMCIGKLYHTDSHNSPILVSLPVSILPCIITRCAYAQGRVKRLSPSIYLFVCVSSKNTAVCCLTARKSPRNSSLPLGLAIYILRKMPRKPDESSVECYGHGFLIAARPRGV